MVDVVEMIDTGRRPVEPADTLRSGGHGWCRVGQLITAWPALTKLFRYAGVSAISTTVSLVVLVSLVVTGSVTSGWANVIATAIGIVPSFELNRRWVWGRSGRRSLGAEMAPFGALSFASLAISSLVVSWATTWVSAAGWGTSIRAGVAVVANLSAFGAMWVAQYILLDRVLFRPRLGARVLPPGGSVRAVTADRTFGSGMLPVGDGQ
jgi:putative flippase GtrA